MKIKRIEQPATFEAVEEIKGADYYRLVGEQEDGCGKAHYEIKLSKDEWKDSNVVNYRTSIQHYYRPLSETIRKHFACGVFGVAIIQLYLDNIPVSMQKFQFTNHKAIAPIRPPMFIRV